MNRELADFNTAKSRPADTDLSDGERADGHCTDCKSPERQRSHGRKGDCRKAGLSHRKARL